MLFASGNLTRCEEGDINESQWLMPLSDVRGNVNKWILGFEPVPFNP